MAKFVNPLCCVIFVIFCLIGSTSVGKIDAAWADAHATFYGDIHGGETMQGACGYGTLFKEIYGLETTALSTALFKDGLACGACFELKCVNDPMWCLPGTIKVTATNFCPPNYSKPNENWCNPPLQHFDLSMPMFLKIAKYEAGIVPVKYRRVLCYRYGGVKFELKGNPWWLLVLAFNVARAGDVVDMKIKWPSTGWIQMTRNWGQNWQTDTLYFGQPGSFQVTTSDGKMVQFDDVLPPSWSFGQTYDGKYNFH